MKLTTKLILLSLFFFCFVIRAQNTYIPNNTSGYVNFNLGKSTLKHTKTQQISLYGCNTSITLNSKTIDAPKGVKSPFGFHWKKKNQVVSGVPFGYQTDTVTQNIFYISEYYIASPPVLKKNKDKSKDIYDIGLITPDDFIFDGKKPVQLVYLDYEILKPMHIAYINIEFDKSFTKKVDRELVQLIPFKVECKDFPWIDTKKIKNAEGATGIGAFDRTIKIIGQQPNRLFLPYFYDNNAKNYLDCEVTLLNDIILNYELFFMVDGKPQQTINLKEYYSKHGAKTVKIHVKERKELPCGCSAPEK